MSHTSCVRGILIAAYEEKDGVDVPPIAAYHYAAIDVKGDTVEVTARGIDGKILDHFVQPERKP